MNTRIVLCSILYSKMIPDLCHLSVCPRHSAEEDENRTKDERRRKSRREEGAYSSKVGEDSWKMAVRIGG